MQNGEDSREYSINVPPLLIKLFPVGVALASLIAGFAAAQTTLKAQEARLSQAESDIKSNYQRSIDNQRDIDIALRRIDVNIGRLCEKIQADCK